MWESYERGLSKQMLTVAVWNVNDTLYINQIIKTLWPFLWFPTALDFSHRCHKLMHRVVRFTAGVKFDISSTGSDQFCLFSCSQLVIWVY